MANIKFLTGGKKDIDTQIKIGAINTGNVILTSDTDEIVFINPKSGKRVMTSRTQKEYTVKGTDLGGIKEGTVIKEGTSLDDLLQMITQKRIPAKYVAPVIALTNGGESAYEVGAKVTPVIKSSFAQNDAGVLVQHNILKDGEVVAESTTANPLTYEQEFTVEEGTTFFSSEASYQAGAIKKDNLGEDSPEGAIAGGSISSNAVSISGKRSLFYGTGIGELPELNSANVRELEHFKLNPVANTEFDIVIAAGQQYAIFAYPSSLRDVSKVTYVEMNDAFMAENFSKNLVQVEGANGYTSAEYKVYTYRMAVPAAAPMTFRVNI